MVIGTIPPEARSFFGDGFVELPEDGSDEEIKGIIRSLLKDKDALLRRASAGHDRISSEFSNIQFSKKFVLLIQDLLLAGKGSEFSCV